MVKIGIPRALAYYQYFPMWRAFFEKLGAEVVVSPATTQKMLSDGSKRVVAETCLPAKVYLGHILTLVGKCDYVFIPIIRSVKSKVYNCSKFLGLPDMTRAVIPECPPVLDIDVDINKGLDKLYDDIYKLGKTFTNDKKLLKQAITEGWQVYLDYLKLMSDHQLMPEQAITRIFGKPDSDVKTTPRNNPEKMTIALIGHHYLLYDQQLNHRLVHRLQDAGCRIKTPEMLTGAQLESATQKVVNKAYWTWEEEVVGAASHYITDGVDGIIGVLAFGCGPDSLMMDIAHRYAYQESKTPFMILTLEEHTAETGIVTRLEAFLDMIQRRKRRLSCA